MSHGIFSLYHLYLSSFTYVDVVSGIAYMINEVNYVIKEKHINLFNNTVLTLVSLVLLVRSDFVSVCVLPRPVRQALIQVRMKE